MIQFRHTEGVGVQVVVAFSDAVQCELAKKFVESSKEGVITIKPLKEIGEVPVAGQQEGYVLSVVKGEDVVNAISSIARDTIEQTLIKKSEGEK